jgi:hypothetical protein
MHNSAAFGIFYVNYRVSENQPIRSDREVERPLELQCFESIPHLSIESLPSLITAEQEVPIKLIQGDDDEVPGHDKLITCTAFEDNTQQTL